MKFFEMPAASETKPTADKEKAAAPAPSLTVNIGDRVQATEIIYRDGVIVAWPGSRATVFEQTRRGDCYVRFDRSTVLTEVDVGEDGQVVLVVP